MTDIKENVPAGVTPASPCGTTGFAATVGFFDGVHLGHCFLLGQVAAQAARRGLRPLVVTFAEHPRRVLGGEAPALLTPPEEKLRLIAAQGIDTCELLTFTPQMAALTARRFMTEYLRDRFGVRCLLMGYDHRFGSDRGATFGDYAGWGREAGIEVVQATELPADGLHVSSSAVRRFLQAGDADGARRCLGRSYALGGTVVHGRGVGRRMGFPTANLRPACPAQLVPATGVYAAWAEVRGVRRKAMVNIGRRPTLDNGRDVSIEACLLDFSADLYGAPLTLFFEHRLRDERKFGSLEALRDALRADACVVEKLLRP